jgi:hypothetical protein
MVFSPLSPSNSQQAKHVCCAAPYFVFSRIVSLTVPSASGLTAFLRKYALTSSVSK